MFNKLQNIIKQYDELMVRMSSSDIMSNIKSSGELSDDDKSGLKEKIEGFVKGF